MMFDLNNKHKAVIIFIIVAVLGVTGYNNYLRERKTIYILNDESQLMASEGTDMHNTIKENDNAEIVIHIEGEVVSPGIYTLAKGARVVDAVNMAGGLNNEADSKKINLAKKIIDEEFIYIPSEDDEDFEYQALNISNKNGLVNINYADKAELETLPGIGPTLAERIIDYRNTIGHFKSTDDIRNVSGIGDKKFEDIKDKITL